MACSQGGVYLLNSLRIVIKIKNSIAGILMKAYSGLTNNPPEG